MAVRVLFKTEIRTSLLKAISWLPIVLKKYKTRESPLLTWTRLTLSTSGPPVTLRRLGLLRAPGSRAAPPHLGSHTPPHPQSFLGLAPIISIFLQRLLPPSLNHLHSTAHPSPLPFPSLASHRNVVCYQLQLRNAPVHNFLRTLLLISPLHSKILESNRSSIGAGVCPSCSNTAESLYLSWCQTPARLQSTDKEPMKEGVDE